MRRTDAPVLPLTEALADGVEQRLCEPPPRHHQVEDRVKACSPILLHLADGDDVLCGTLSVGAPWRFFTRSAEAQHKRIAATSQWRTGRGERGAPVAHTISSDEVQWFAVRVRPRICCCCCCFLRQRVRGCDGCLGSLRCRRFRFGTSHFRTRKSLSRTLDHRFFESLKKAHAKHDFVVSFVNRHVRFGAGLFRGRIPRLLGRGLIPRVGCTVFNKGRF